LQPQKQELWQLTRFYLPIYQQITTLARATSVSTCLAAQSAVESMDPYTFSKCPQALMLMAANKCSAAAPNPKVLLAEVHQLSGSFFACAWHKPCRH
jgi:hypothetical protein